MIISGHFTSPQWSERLKNWRTESFRYKNIKGYSSRLEGNYARTRASDTKHLLALIHSIFLVNILGICLIFGLSTKKLGLTMVLFGSMLEVA